MLLIGVRTAQSDPDESNTLLESLFPFVVGATTLFVLLDYERTVRCLVCGTFRNIDALLIISLPFLSQFAPRSTGGPITVMIPA